MERTVTEYCVYGFNTHDRSGTPANISEIIEMEFNSLDKATACFEKYKDLFEHLQIEELTGTETEVIRCNDESEEMN